MARRTALRSKTGDARASRGESRRLAVALAETGRAFYGRGWAMGTSGNFSAVLRREPLRLLMTSSGLDKRTLEAKHFVELDARGAVLRGTGKPSAEALVHVAVARVRAAGAILHTHSVWSTLLSDQYASEAGLAISGYEMLKGLAGVITHQHSEWLPIFENSQDMKALAAEVEAVLLRHPAAHGFLLRAHGLYTWGEDIPQARRHVEILEFLMEVVGRTRNGAADLGRK